MIPNRKIAENFSDSSACNQVLPFSLFGLEGLSLIQYVLCYLIIEFLEPYLINSFSGILDLYFASTTFKAAHVESLQSVGGNSQSPKSKLKIF